MSLPPALRPRRLEGVGGVVLAAVLLAFGLNLLLQPPNSLLEGVARALGFAVGAGIQVLFGMWLGARSWPRRGLRLSRLVLRRMARGKGAPLLFVTDRPDASMNLGRRLLDVVGFAAGASVLLAGILPLLGVASVNVFALAATLSLLTLWGSFLLVPYWLFARMGLRRVDPIRLLVLPVSRGYADRLRLSNGALLLLALGTSVNLAFRAGLSGEEALVQGIHGLLILVIGLFLVSVTAVAFYERGERALAKEFEREALAMGVRDGRGMSDGDFLPRLGAR